LGSIDQPHYLYIILMHSKGAKKHTSINAHYRMMKYEMKEIWNWKQVEIILWKEQKDRERKEISEERREVEESDNDITY